jgi:glycosyltransferase involved in cell wall biosynthesis
MPRVAQRSYDVAFYLPTLGPLLSRSPEVAAGGGAETQIWLLARGLARRGCAACVIVADAGEEVPASVDGVDVVVRPPWQGGRGLRGRVAELRALWRTLAPLRAGAVVQRTAGMSTGLVGAVTKARGRRFVYSSANIVDFEFERLASKRSENSLFKLGVRLADTIVVQTDEQAARCREKFGRQPIIIKSIAEAASPRAELPETFLWVGRIVAYKRPEAFIELARALPHARFRMVALPSEDDPDLHRRIEHDARPLSNLELHGPRPRPELLRLYDSAVAVVNTADFEGMPNVFLEGWSRGVPALTLTHDPDGVISAYGLGGVASCSQDRLVKLAEQVWSSRADQRDVAARCLDYVRREHGAEAVVGQWMDALGFSAAAASALRVNGAGAASYGRSR